MYYTILDEPYDVLYIALLFAKGSGGRQNSTIGLPLYMVTLCAYTACVICMIHGNTRTEVYTEIRVNW